MRKPATIISSYLRLKSQMSKQILATEMLVVLNFCLQLGGEICHSLTPSSVPLPDSLPSIQNVCSHSFFSSPPSLLLSLVLPCHLFSIGHMEAFLSSLLSAFHPAVFPVDSISYPTLWLVPSLLCTLQTHCHSPVLAHLSDLPLPLPTPALLPQLPFCCHPHALPGLIAFHFSSG